MDFVVVFWVSAVFHSFICAGLCSYLAREKGYDSLLFGKNPVDRHSSEGYYRPLRISVWLLLGFLFGGFALIAAAGLPDRKKG